MSKIKVMNESLANKIAAGEVVEKMMNVVKELVENSIDAESDEITVVLQDSGVKMIAVRDNGIGMDPDDAVLAFHRHATSKCRNLNDLFHISSLGFRGEALPSIASVSHVTLKTSNSKIGTFLEIQGGEIVKQERADLQKGCDIVVTDLFYNTPVRLKYIKNLYTELSHIVDYMNKMALSYPTIQFTLINNDHSLLKTDGSGDLLKVIYEIYGARISRKMVFVEGENDDYSLSGYLSYPEIARSNRNAITVLVNGRVIKNNDVIRLLVDSYHDYLPKGKYPFVVLNIEVDPILVDVNVHPTKMDVKFSKMDTLKELIQEVVSNNLKKLVMIPSATVRDTFVLEEEKEADSVSPVSEEVVKDLLDDDIKDEDIELSQDARFEDFSEQMQLVQQAEESPYKIKKMIPRGIIYKTYIFAENEDGMFLIDQHAAAERVNYEKCMDFLSSPKKEQIPLLVPISLEFPQNEYLVIQHHLDLLKQLGFQVEEFGIHTFVVRSHPMFLVREDHEKEDIMKIFELIALKESFQEDKFLHHMAATMACRMSIKANDYITLEEAEYVLDQLRCCRNPFHCPHGRPTIITYTKYELEKMFKRVMN